jgi:hypothetical protein
MDHVLDNPLPETKVVIREESRWGNAIWRGGKVLKGNDSGRFFW